MKLSSKQRNEFSLEVGRILWEDWDPIGIDGCGSTDEYNGYAPSIIQLLLSQASEEKISKMLLHHANVNMGMSTELESHVGAAKNLIKLRDEYSGE